MLASGLLVVHDTSRGGEDDIAELTGREQLDNPLLEVGETDVVSGGDDTSLVETKEQSVLGMTVDIEYTYRPFN